MDAEGAADGEKANSSLVTRQAEKDAVACMQCAERADEGDKETTKERESDLRLNQTRMGLLLSTGHVGCGEPDRPKGQSAVDHTTRAATEPPPAWQQAGR